MALDPEQQAVLKQFYGLRAGDPMPTAAQLREALAAAKAEGRAEQRAADIAALRAAPPDPFQTEPWQEKAADYLEHLGASTTEEAGDG